MSSRSRPTSSSSGHTSSSPGRPLSPPGRPISPVGQPSSSTSSFSSSSTADSLSVGVAEVPPQVEVVRGDDPAIAVDRLDSLPVVAPLADRSSSPPMVVPIEDLGWVDPRVVEISFSYDTEDVVTEFLLKHPVLKPGVHSHYFSVVPCGSAERVCMGRPGAGPPFFYMYICFFSDLHVTLPFDEFTMGVLRVLNVAPTQVHPNTWVSLQAFRLLCNVMRLHPTPVLLFMLLQFPSR